MSETMDGGCQCGRVRFSARIDDDEAYLCHCRMCQRATGNISIAFKNVMAADVEWTGSPPDLYRSSPLADREFCATCGTSISFRYLDSDKMDLTVATFDDPSRFRPTHHFGFESAQKAWLDTSGLPQTDSDTYQPLIDRWKEHGG